jgi:hypothetical protein
VGAAFLRVPPIFASGSRGKRITGDSTRARFLFAENGVNERYGDLSPTILRADVRFVLLRYLAVDIGPEFLHLDRDRVEAHLRSQGANHVGEGPFGRYERVRIRRGTEIRPQAEREKTNSDVASSKFCPEMFPLEQWLTFKFPAAYVRALREVRCPRHERGVKFVKRGVPKRKPQNNRFYNLSCFPKP